MTCQPLDLADLTSVAAAADALATMPTLDVLVANAGAIGYPEQVRPAGERGRRQQQTADGHELFWGTNFLGHYALVGQLLPLLLASGGRCVFLGSLGDRLVPLPADAVPEPELAASDLAKYGQSKLATITFMSELARRTAGRGIVVSGAHPGAAADSLSSPRDGVAMNQPDTAGPLLRVLSRAFIQGKDAGALPVLTAAACPQASSGAYWGPRWITRGRPRRTHLSPSTRDTRTAGRLIETAADLTNFSLPV